MTSDGPQAAFEASTASSRWTPTAPPIARPGECDACGGAHRSGECYTVPAVAAALAELRANVERLRKVPPWPEFGAEGHEPYARMGHSQALDEVLDLLGGDQS